MSVSGFLSSVAIMKKIASTEHCKETEEHTSISNYMLAQPLRQIYYTLVYSLTCCRNILFIKR